MPLRSLALASILFSLNLAPGAELPPVRVPDCLGVNIHFDDPLPGEMEMIHDAGFRVIRADMIWDQIELKRGEYDFSRFDRILGACEQHGFRVLTPLVYSNPLYDGNLSPHTDEGVAAFVRFARAAVQRYKGRGVIWEMYNEPNNVFWRPAPDVNAYIKLATAVGKAIKDVSADELYVGPALSGTDGAWVTPCYKAGLLSYWDAVTVHPYGNPPPEERERHFAGSRALIDRYRPEDKPMPLLSGEWGYTSVQFSPQMQAKLLARQWLTNLLNGIGMSIWYDWRDDGNDPNNAEHHFGVVENAARNKGEKAPLTPKPAYHAARALTTHLDGFTFAQRVPLGSKDDYLLLFMKGQAIRGVTWTTSATPHTVTLPASAGRFTVSDFLGGALAPLDADVDGLTIELTDGPKYLLPQNADPRWKALLK